MAKEVRDGLADIGVGSSVRKTVFKPDVKKSSLADGLALFEINLSNKDGTVSADRLFDRLRSNGQILTR